MKTAMETLPARVHAGGVAFDAVDWGGMSVAHVRLPKGADAAPLLDGLPDALCHAPHWGLVLRGSIHVTFRDGREEVVKAGEVYHWPAGHTVRCDEDYESIEFSPEKSMNEVLTHLKKKLQTA